MSIYVNVILAPEEEEEEVKVERRMTKKLQRQINHGNHEIGTIS